jgi:UDPglucose 6-dehydrogenase
MSIAVLGTGYVGLVSAVCLADTGKHVYCIDKDDEKLAAIRKGIAPIFEPGLDDLLNKNRKRIIPTDNLREAVENSTVVFIAVGTPFDGGHIDLTGIKQAAQEIGQVMRTVSGYKVIVVKSTVVPGTTVNVIKPIILEHSGKTDRDVGFCMNPEFLREGCAVEDFGTPDRIVLGVTSKSVEEIMRDVYSGFPDAEIVITNPSTAEMIKYAANAYLALTISYANEIARMCEKIRAVDSEDVFHGVVLDKRISPILGNKRVVPQLVTYLKAGCGFGGSCFPKDVKALAAFEKEIDSKGGLLDMLLLINAQQVEHVFQTGVRFFTGILQNITILGTAFKPDTDDIRESPGIKLAHSALDKGYTVSVHDYAALENTKKFFGERVRYYDDPLLAMRNADIIFIATCWNKYLDIPDDEFEKNMKTGAIMIDCRSLYASRAHKPWRKRIGVCYEE